MLHLGGDSGFRYSNALVSGEMYPNFDSLAQHMEPELRIALSSLRHDFAPNLDSARLQLL